jgi:SH3-like domain-containing protein
MRSGPGKQYPIIWHYNILRLPVLVLACFNDWVKIRDYGKTEGWVHKSLLGKKKTAITVLKISMMHKSPNADSVLIAKLEQNVICEVVSTKDNWVKISVSGLKGWVAAYSLWGYRSD